jgi:hypothetical protein
VLAAAVGLVPAVGAQGVPPDLARDRAAYAEWLATAPQSPFAALALVPVGAKTTIGPDDADAPIPGVPAATLTQSGGTVTVTTAEGTRPLPRGRLTPLGASHRLLAAGPPGRATVAVFGPPRPAKAPTYFPYAKDAVVRVTLVPLPAPRPVAMLGPEGQEVRGADVGSAHGTFRGRPLRVTVRRLPGATPDEAELEVFFRDGTSGKTSYDGGRFVTLVPDGTDGTYLLDFNRARNPSCAYNAIFPCPAPWPNNLLDVAVEAGERYERMRPGAPGA